MNISQTLSKYESWRENGKEVLRQCKRKLDTLKENAFVEPTTTPSSVELWWDSSLRCFFPWIYVNICACKCMYNICVYNIYIYNICVYIHLYIVCTRFRGRDIWLSNISKFECIEIYRHQHLLDHEKCVLLVEWEDCILYTKPKTFL